MKIEKFEDIQAAALDLHCLPKKDFGSAYTQELVKKLINGFIAIPKTIHEKSKLQHRETAALQLMVTLV